MNTPVDQQARTQAIDPRRSVIVQAPAGSGKTGLLVRRFLVLLATVEAPEQILAITFTRKATAEMRQRVLNALAGVDEDGEPEKNRALHALGQAALLRDQEMDWQLLDNSQRIRIQTIDSFCSELVRRMPWSARFGSPPTLIEDGTALYDEASSNTLDLIEDRHHANLANDAGVLITLLDSNRQSAVALLAGMLSNRDQWMRNLDRFDRDQVEGWWRTTIEESLRDLCALLSLPERNQLCGLAAFAAHSLQTYRKEKPTHPFSAVEVWLEQSGFPDPTWQNVAHWQGVAALVLTKKGELRRKVDKRDGFPVNAPEKDQLLSLLDHFGERPKLIRALRRVQLLPLGTLSDAQWRVISALLRLLPVAAAQLRVLFGERNIADYAELAQRADMALGRLDEPSDLALAMDYRLQHLLMDEFQDTSSGQIQLLEKLVSGWVPGDGRTAFFVGDPMQSIYRFREAEVGIFLDVQDRGIGSLQPEATSLVCNFRSGPALVDWFNESFARVMPADRDIIHGAVDYSPAAAVRPPEPGCAAYVHAGIECGAEEEAAQIVDVIESTLAAFPDDRIAILGRARSHLAAIIANLDARGVPWQGIRLQPLAQRQAIQDLLALTLALIDPADRVAWLGVLRGPWLGASLEELEPLCGRHESMTILAQLREAAFQERLERSRRARFDYVTKTLSDAVSRRGVMTIRTNLEACWMALGGATALSRTDVDNSLRFIELVEQLDSENGGLDEESILSALDNLYADSGDETQVQLLTIHAAKGLEFDTVILPGLHRPGRSEDPTLLRWKTFPDRILVASRPSSEDRSDPYFDFLSGLDKEHRRNEMSRLLYVACTRACKRLHLYGSVGIDRKKDLALKPPPSTSLLNVLWPAVADEFNEALSAYSDADAEPVEDAGTIPVFPLTRLPDDWCIPPMAPGITIDSSRLGSAVSDTIEFDWARNLTRITGIVIHRILEEIGTTDWDCWRQRRFSDRDHQLWRNRLAQHGLADSQLDQALRQVETVLESARTDDIAAWIFSGDHKDVKTEWSLTGLVDGSVRHIVIDRCFIDQEGVCWLIDFKTGNHDDPSTLEQFLDSERQRYSVTMAEYIRIVSNLGHTAVRAALYYPAINQLVAMRV